jgi:hypothetical protein
MSTAKSDIIKGMISGLKLSALWIFLASTRFGVDLGTVLWKPHDVLYPFDVVFWGVVTVAMIVANRGSLVRLTYSVALAEADATRTKTRGILIANFGNACISFCFGLCVVASKRVGGLYPVALTVFGVLLFLVGIHINREIKRLAAFMTSLGELRSI